MLSLLGAMFLWGQDQRSEALGSEEHGDDSTEPKGSGKGIAPGPPRNAMLVSN